MEGHHQPHHDGQQPTKGTCTMGRAQLEEPVAALLKSNSPGRTSAVQDHLQQRCRDGQTARSATQGVYGTRQTNAVLV